MMGTLNNITNNKIFTISKTNSGSSNISSSYISENENDRLNEVARLFVATTESGGYNEDVTEQIHSEGVDNMDDNKLLEMYINRMENDTKEFKQDIRDTEKRMDERLNRIEDMISSQNNKFDEKFDRFDDKLERINNKIDDRFNTLNDKIEKVKDDIQKGETDRNRFWIGLVASILIGLGSIIVTLIK